MDKAINSKLRTLEEMVSQVEYNQDSCRPFIKLAQDSTSLAKIQQLIIEFDKTNLEIQRQYQINQQTLEQLKDMLDQNAAIRDNKIQQQIQKREDILLRIDQKLQKLENQFQIVSNDQEVNIDQVEMNLKQQVDQIVCTATEKFGLDKSGIEETIAKTVAEIDHSLQQVSDAQRASNQVLERFESKFSDVIRKPGTRTEGTNDLRQQVINQGKSLINEAVEECRYMMDVKFRSLMTKYNADIGAIQAQLDNIAKGGAPTPAREGKGGGKAGKGKSGKTVKPAAKPAGKTVKKAKKK